MNADLLFTLVVGTIFGALVSLPAFLLTSSVMLRWVSACVFVLVALFVLRLFLGHIGNMWNWQTLVPSFFGALLAGLVVGVVRRTRKQQNASKQA